LDGRCRTKPFEVVQDVFWVGALHPELKIFDDLMPTRRGTTYNSYLVRGDRIAVIDAVKGLFADEFLRNLSSLVDLKRIDAIVLNHTEPDHSGALEAFLAAAPQARVYASKAARLYLGDLLNRPFECFAANEYPELPLGRKTLQFIPAPFIHWPDTIFTWLPEDGILFPCDGFATHFSDERMFNDLAGDFEEDFHVYYDSLMRPYRDKVLAALDAIQGLDIRMICPSHGPILRRNPKHYIEKYREWATLKPRAKPSVALLYMSAHGNTERMAAAVAEGIRRAGADAELLHLTEVDDARVRDALESADGLIFASPTIVRDLPPAMWHALSLLSTVKLRAKKAAALGSYGWSGEAVAFIEQRLKEMRIPLVESGPKIKFSPAAEDLEKCRDFGARFAAAVAGG
jgi:flavorubredoxin